MYKEKIKIFAKSKHFKNTAIGLGIVAGILVVFHAGSEYGYHKAEFILQSADNNYPSIRQGMTKRGGVMGFVSDDTASSHGVIGKIVSVALPTIIVEGKDNTEKTVRIDDDTLIRKGRDEIDQSVLVAGDMIMVVGTPNSNAEIGAKLIRILPPQNASPSVKK